MVAVTRPGTMVVTADEFEIVMTLVLTNTLTDVLPILIEVDVICVFCDVLLIASDVALMTALALERCPRYMAKGIGCWQ